MTDQVLGIGGISRRYGSVPAPQEMTFHARPGEVVGFVDPNGSGTAAT